MAENRPLSPRDWRCERKGLCFASSACRCLFALLAKVSPFGHGIKRFGKLRERLGDIYSLWAHLAARATVDAISRSLSFGHRIHLHGDGEAALELQVIVGCEHQRDVDSLWA